MIRSGIGWLIATVVAIAAAVAVFTYNRTIAAPDAAPGELAATQALWDSMDRGRHRWLDESPSEPLTLLIQAMILGSDYVCEQVVRITGHGPFERGRYAKVMCLADSAEHDYRVELWQDRDTSVVRPWIPSVDNRW